MHPERCNFVADMIRRQSQMFQSAQAAHADHAAKKEPHTVAEITMSITPRTTAESLNHLGVTAEVITVQIREGLTDSAS